MPAGVRQLQNTAPLSRDSLRASSVASVSVTGSLNRCVPVSNNLEKTVCEVPTQQPSSSAKMLPRVLPSAQSGKIIFCLSLLFLNKYIACSIGPTNGDTSIQAHGSKRNEIVQRNRRSQFGIGKQRSVHCHGKFLRVFETYRNVYFKIQS